MTYIQLLPVDKGWTHDLSYKIADYLVEIHDRHIDTLAVPASIRIMAMVQEAIDRQTIGVKEGRKQRNLPNAYAILENIHKNRELSIQMLNHIDRLFSNIEDKTQA